jgi:hypothetical protein
MTNVVSISKIIDVQSIIESTPADRRDFRNVLFIFKGTEVNGLRVNYYTSYSAVVTAYGSNTEPAKAALKFFAGGFRGIKPQKFWVANFDESGGEVWATVIAELLEDPRYYFMSLDITFTEDENKALAAAIEASTKIKYMGGFLSFDWIAASTPLVSDETSLPKYFYTQDYAKSFTHFDSFSASAEYKQLADLSYFATVGYTKERPLGSLAFKSFSGQTPTDFGQNADSYTDYLDAKHCNYYTPFGEVGRNITYKGILCNGMQIKVQVGTDWLEYNIAYAIFDLLTDLPDLAYTQAEFNMLYSAMDTVCQQAVAFKLFAPGVDNNTGINYPNGYTITIPAPKDISSTDKANGVLNGVYITGLIGGSAIKFEVTNILKY